ncbi:hypothetical protein TRFO_03686 [Tritrichomonas foetus]|uniref:USP domain-containing protein n=1 Tax=Tritrichomonas foetus TaxID=1144522 RepID=A0A1J4KLH2_9EUKA|nr:hypothetical protein TRFO_03686 [Tritrichomonas foetus]|eukprot:OHT12075.1 hypothetical protein TRFO_03686 [Tritrichomonas foetus]
MQDDFNDDLAIKITQILHNENARCNVDESFLTDLLITFDKLPETYENNPDGFFKGVNVSFVDPILKMKTIFNNDEKNAIEIFFGFILRICHNFLDTKIPELIQLITSIFKENCKLYKNNFSIFEKLKLLLITDNLYKSLITLVIQKDIDCFSLLSISKIFFSTQIFDLFQNQKIDNLNENEQMNWIDYIILVLNYLEDEKFLLSSSETNLSNLFDCIYYEMAVRKREQPKIIIEKLVIIIKKAIETDKLSLVLFALKTTKLMFLEPFTKEFCQELKLKNVDFTKVSIRSEFSSLLSFIFEYLVRNSLFDENSIKSLWEEHYFQHVSLLSSFFMIFIGISHSIPSDKAIWFLNLVSNPDKVTKEWLTSFISIGVNLNSHGISNCSNFILEKLEHLQNDSKIQENSELFSIIVKEIPKFRALSMSYNDFNEFFIQTALKLNEETETEDDLIILQNALPKYHMDPSDFIQSYFYMMIDVFKRQYHLYDCIINIIDIFISNYNAKIDEKIARNFFKVAENVPRVYNFIQILISKGIFDSEILFNSLSNTETIDVRFYRLIKSLYPKTISSFPFDKEEILWYFSLHKSNEQRRFQKLLCRLYSSNLCDDYEMVENFINTWLAYFIDNDTDKNELCYLARNFIDRIEFLIDVPFERHIGELNENRVAITMDEFGTFEYNRFLSVSSLIHHLYGDWICSLSYKKEILDNSQCLHRAINQKKSVKLKRKSFSQHNSNNNPKIRTCFPSLYFLKIDNLVNDLFSIVDGDELLNILPTFQETINQATSLVPSEFETFFPTDCPPKFVYNFETFMIEFNKINKDEFKYTDELVSYLIRNGLSIIYSPLLCRIISYLTDCDFDFENKYGYAFNAQIVNIFDQFIPDPGETSNILSKIFELKLRHFCIEKAQFKQLILHETYEIRNGACLFFSEIDLPLSYFAEIYNEESNNSEFYGLPKEFFDSLSNHIYLSNERNDEIISIVFNILFENTDNYIYDEHIRCLNSLLRSGFLSEQEREKCARFLIDNFLRENIPPVPTFDEAMNCIQYIFDNKLIKNQLTRLIQEHNDYIQYNIDVNSSNSNQFDLIDADDIIFKDINYIGLDNLGTTCYANSDIQQLFYCQNFFNELFVLDEDRNMINDLKNELQELFITMKYSQMKSISPKKVFYAYDENFCTNVQEDCFEFLLFLLDRIGSKVFGGTFRHVISSIDGEDSKTILEPFNILQLEIKNMSCLEESLQHFSSVDYLTGDSGYRFDNGLKKDSIKKCEINEMSDDLIIQLKRFEYNIETYEREKINSYFIFPEIIFDNYELKGIILHRGYAESGHYISLVKINGRWLMFNDDRVSYEDESYVFDMAYGYDDTSAYLLFYSKKKEDEKNSNENILKCENSSDTIKVNLPSNLIEKVITSNEEKFYDKIVLSRSFFRMLLNLLDSNDEDYYHLIIDFFFKILFMSPYTNRPDDLFSLIMEKIINYPTIKEYVMIQPIQYSIIHSQLIEMRKTASLLIIECVQNLNDFKVVLNLINYLGLSYVCSTDEMFSVIHKLIVIEEYQNYAKSTLFAKKIENYLIKDFDSICCDCQRYENVCFNQLFAVLVKLGVSPEFEDFVVDNLSWISAIVGSKTLQENILELFSSFSKKNEIYISLNNIIENMLDNYDIVSNIIAFL